MKLYIVSNRLPVAFKESKGSYIINKSPGGLVSGISAYLDSINSSSLDKTNYHWVGWPGLTFPENKKLEIDKLLKTSKLIPIFLNEKTMDKFYYGFCNKTIWPLFHYFPAYSAYENEMWENYKLVNEKFCDIICDYLNNDDTIWIHDYHLMLLPGLIRKKVYNAKIGFFLHIPFPHFEIFRLFPPEWREEILKGILGADLIGFHTNDYTRYFLGCVLRLLGYNNDLGEIQFEDRIIKIDTFPMGIDFKVFNDLSVSENVVNESKSLKMNFKNRKIILSIDRLDYSKGILNRLEGFQLFLEKNPQWHKKVTMLVIMVPSRIGVERYDQMKKEIDEIIGKINGLYSSLHWTPIIYQFKSFNNEQLSAFYGISDVALITPLRDGMNLIAKEYISSRVDGTGVLILSEMAGASKEMIETIIINPNHIENIANAIKDALEMEKSEQMERNNIIRERLKNNDVFKWANNFLVSLIHIKSKQMTFGKKYLDDDIKTKLIKDFKKSKKSIIFLDYDGTLVPFFDDPKKACPDAELIQLLTSLTSDNSIHLVIISGRDYQTLDEWFWNIKASLIAEHGVWLKKKFKKWKIAKKMESGWKSNIIPILKEYSNRLAGSFYEEKSHSLVWHYRKADKIHGEIIANELVDNLIDITASMNLQVLRGHNIVEIRNIDINKGTAVKNFNNGVNYDFILSIGDDWTDEDMFKALPQEAYSIKVGMSRSFSKFNLYNYSEVRSLLKDIINAK
jgi:trehalose 6-phosphate synthase/phosphatase